MPQKALAWLIGAILLAGALAIVTSITGERLDSNMNWSEEHGHWHQAP